MLSSILETSFHPDLVILDINMPFKNGIICLQDITADPELQALKVIIYSTSSNQTDIDKCYNAGADFYLVKPSSFAAIVDNFKKMFNSDHFNNNTKAPKSEFVIVEKRSFN
jgi:DNA-binding NarL/FixJ family response regulator